MEINAIPYPAHILIVDDDSDVLLSTRLLLRRHFKDVRVEKDPSRLMEAIKSESFDVILLDMNYRRGETSGEEGLLLLKRIKFMNPDASVVVMTAYGEIELAVHSMKEGAADFLVKPWDNKKLLGTVFSSWKLSQARKELNHLRSQQAVLSHDMDSKFAEIIGQSAGMRAIFSRMDKIARTDVNVLILGENGTGKELIARALHRHSPRAGQIFLPVDMGSISEGLFESELFGHVRGAYTDAHDNRIGRFELASGGTLFLDEIGNLSLPMQAKLLNVLQNREVTKVGSSKSNPVDIRLISATNLPLQEMVLHNQFRQDLLYRINTVELHLPPLRERGRDIQLLAEHFIRHYTRKYQKQHLSISQEFFDKLMTYHWPGNVRELQHVIERAVILCESECVGALDVNLDGDPVKSEMPDSLNLIELERSAIERAVNKCKGNLSRAARELGLGRTTLYRKLGKYGM